MPTTLALLILAGVFTFILLMFFSVKIFLKLRKEELSYCQNVAIVKIEEIYKINELITYQQKGTTYHSAYKNGLIPIKHFVEIIDKYEIFGLALVGRDVVEWVQKDSPGENPGLFQGVYRKGAF